MEWATVFAPGYGVDVSHIRTTILYKELKPRPSKVILLRTNREKILRCQKKPPDFYQVIGDFPRLRSTKYGMQIYHIFFIQGTLVFQGPLDILVQRRCNSGIDYVRRMYVSIFWRSDLQASGIVVWFGLSPWSVRFLF